MARFQNHEFIVSEVKSNTVVKKLKITEINGCKMFGKWTGTDYHT